MSGTSGGSGQPQAPGSPRDSNTSIGSGSQPPQQQGTPGPQQQPRSPVGKVAQYILDTAPPMPIPGSPGSLTASTATTPAKQPATTATAPPSAATTPATASGQQPSVQQQQQQQHPPHLAPPPLVPSLSTQSWTSRNSNDASVLLGVEALERQQALVEQRRKMAAQQQLQQRQVHQQQAQQQQQQQQMVQGQHYGSLLPMSHVHLQQPGSHDTDDAHTAASSDLASQSAASVQGSASAHAPPPGSQPTGQRGGGMGQAIAAGGAGGGIMGNRPRSGSSGGMLKRSSSFVNQFLKTPLKLTKSLSTGENKNGGGGGDGTGKNTTLSPDGTAMMSPPPGEAAPTTGGNRRRTTRGSISSNPAADDIDNDDDVLWKDNEVKPLVYGYLSKLGRNGHWQKRFFESDGECLTYYKTRKRAKLLASLDLLKVGTIRCDDDDPTGCVFCIQVADRPYFLRAESRAACKDWVISLNRIKEARMEIGGIQLVQPHFSHEEGIEVSDLSGLGKRDRTRSTESDECAARVVMIANRNRTRAIATTETEESLKKMIIPDYPDTGNAPPSPKPTIPPVTIREDALTQSPRLNMPPAVLATWKKRRSTMQRLRWRLTQWARKINVMACVRPGEVTQHQYTPDMDAFGGTARVGGELSDIDEHGSVQPPVQPVGSMSSGRTESGDYDGNVIT